MRFLSHLCGGEAFHVTHYYVSDFLSHLCGGEVGKIAVILIIAFLSHLCGGEDIELLLKQAFGLSKPPMRW